MASAIPQIMEVDNKMIFVYQRVPSMRELNREFYPFFTDNSNSDPSVKDLFHFPTVANIFCGNIRGLDLEGYNFLRRFDRLPELDQGLFDSLVKDQVLEKLVFDPTNFHNEPKPDKMTDVYFPTEEFFLRFYGFKQK